MPDLEKLIEELKKLSPSDRQRVLDALRPSAEQSESSFELVDMSELEGVEETTRVIVLDKKMTRGVRRGEEGKQNEIAAEEAWIFYIRSRSRPTWM